MILNYYIQYYHFCSLATLHLIKIKLFLGINQSLEAYLMLTMLNKIDYLFLLKFQFLNP